MSNIIIRGIKDKFIDAFFRMRNRKISDHAPLHKRESPYSGRLCCPSFPYRKPGDIFFGIEVLKKIRIIGRYAEACLLGVVEIDVYIV